MGVVQVYHHFTVRDENQKSDDSNSESTVTTDHSVKDCTNNNIEPLSEQQLLDTEQPDHLLQQSSDNEPLQLDQDNNHSTVSADDHMTRSNVENVVQPSTIDATMPLILKYSRESEEKPADVRAVDQFDAMTTDEPVITCEFCGAEINPDFTPVHNDSSDSEEVNDKDNLMLLLI